MMDATAKRAPITHPRFKYKCIDCERSVMVVIPLPAALFSEYHCSYCRRRTVQTVTYIPPDAPEAT